MPSVALLTVASELNADGETSVQTIAVSSGPAGAPEVLGSIGSMLPAIVAAIETGQRIRISLEYRPSVPLVVQTANEGEGN